MIAALVSLALLALATLAWLHGHMTGYHKGHKAGRDRGFALAWRRLSAAHARRAAALAGAVLVGADGITPVRADRTDDAGRPDGAGGAR